MTKQRDLKLHHHNLMEVRDIMNSMKTLAYMESRKLEQSLPPQLAMLDNIYRVAADFIHAYPQYPIVEKPVNQNDPEIVLLVGSERGFCADFNQALIAHYKRYSRSLSATPIRLAIGLKLFAALEEHDISASAFNGANVREEIESVMLAVVDRIQALQQQYQQVRLSVIYHDASGQIEQQTLLPPFHDLPAKPDTQRIEPILYMDSQRFFARLSVHYIYTKILEILSNSLLLENQIRVSHLQGALTRLDESLEDLKKRINAQRQEEIIEEIEVILLSNMESRIEFGADKDLNADFPNI